MPFPKKLNKILFHTLNVYYAIKFWFFPFNYCAWCGCTGEMEFHTFEDGEQMCIACVETPREERV